MTRNEVEVEHDAKELMASVFSVIDQVHDILGEDFLKIKSAGLATQRSSIVCWDKFTGEALSPIISWQDRRTHTAISQYQNDISHIHNVTGLYLNPHYGVTKMRWCLDNLSAVKNAYDQEALCIAPMASYILFHLLRDKKGESPFVIDPANASRTLLMNLKTCQWEPSLLKLFSIDEYNLPKITLTKNSYGKIQRFGCEIPLNLCTGDQSAAVYSSGELQLHEVFINVGTGAFVLKSTEGIPSLQSEKLLASVVYAEKKFISYVIEGTVNGAGRALSWYAREADFYNFEENIDQWCEIFQDIPVFINAVSGIGSPYWVAESDSYFVDQEGNRLIPCNPLDESNNKKCTGQKFIAVLESIIFLIAENIKKIEKLTESVQIIRLAGGLSASKGFCQKLSNALNCDVILEKEKEATAKGVFNLLIKDACSPFSSAEDSYKYAKEWTGKKRLTNHRDRHKSSVIFHPKNDQMLLTRYHLWQKQMKAHFCAS